jgi:hypothetical protein
MNLFAFRVSNTEIAVSSDENKIQKVTCGATIRRVHSFANDATIHVYIMRHCSAVVRIYIFWYREGILSDAGFYFVITSACGSETC